MPHYLRSVTMLAMALTAAGCDLSRQQANGIAEISVTAVNVVPWPEMRDAYGQFQFDFAPETLLSQAYTTTASINNVLRDSISASLAAKVGQGSTLPTAGGAPATTGAFTAPSAPPLGADGERLDRLELALAEQRVTLNHRMSGIPIQDGYKAFLVNLLISVQPVSRGLPYDTTLEISFAPNAYRSVRAYTNVAPPMYTLPILMTDFEEATQESISNDVLRQVSLALAAAQGIAGGSANIARTIERLKSSLSLKPNSLFTVGNTASGTVLLRIGANRGGNDYEMIPQVHNLAVVLLVDDRLLDHEGECLFTQNIDLQTQKVLTGKESLKEAEWQNAYNPCNVPNPVIDPGNTPVHPDRPFHPSPEALEASKTSKPYFLAYYRGEVSVLTRAFFRDARSSDRRPLESTPLISLLRHTAFPMPLDHVGTCPPLQSAAFTKDASISNASTGTVSLNLNGGSGLSQRVFNAVLQTPPLSNGKRETLVSSLVGTHETGFSVSFPDYNQAFTKPKTGSGKVLTGDLQLFEMKNGIRSGLSCPSGKSSYTALYLPEAGTQHDNTQTKPLTFGNPTSVTFPINITPTSGSTASGK